MLLFVCLVLLLLLQFFIFVFAVRVTLPDVLVTTGIEARFMDECIVWLENEKLACRARDGTTTFRPNIDLKNYPRPFHNDPLPTEQHRYTMVASATSVFVVHTVRGETNYYVGDFV